MTRAEALAWQDRAKRAVGRWTILPNSADYMVTKGTVKSGVVVGIKLLDDGQTWLAIGDYSGAEYTVCGRKPFENFAQALEFIRQRGRQLVPNPEKF